MSVASSALLVPLCVSSLSGQQAQNEDNLISAFRMVYQTERFKFFDDKDGYAFLQSNYYATRFTSESKLIIIESNLDLTPGYIAFHNGSNSYSPVGFKRACLHLKTYPWENEIDYSLIEFRFNFL